MLSIYRLPNQLPDEKVIKILHRDFFVFFKKILLFILLIILPLTFFYLMIAMTPGLLVGQISLPLIILGASAYYLFVWAFFLFTFVDYYLDVWIITNERLINIEQRGYFSRVASEQRLFRIQDVTSELEGVWQTIFKFGDVHIQTAGEAERFVFREVPNPEEVRDMLIKLAEINKSKHPGEGS